MSETRAEADAWVSVFRAMGMDVGGPTDLTHDGSWMVRARSADQRGQRQDAESRSRGAS